jgi:hypothetical protein
MAAQQDKIRIPTGDYARALGIAERFNINSGARPWRRVKASLTNALDFTLALKDEVAGKGSIVTVGSHHGSDTFLDKDRAKEIARAKDRAAYLAGTVDLPVSQRDAERLSSIRRAFNLGSDSQAATLALRLYQSACDNLWRGNSFGVTDRDGGNHRPFDTGRLAEKLTFSR